MRIKAICILMLLMTAACFAQMTGNYNSYDNLTMNFDTNGNLSSATVTLTLEGDTSWGGYPACQHTGYATVDFGDGYSSNSEGPVWPDYYMNTSTYVTLVGTDACFGNGIGCTVDQDYTEVDCDCEGIFYTQDGGYGGDTVPTVSISMQSTGQVAGDNIGRQAYDQAMDSLYLGVSNPCQIGVQFTGTVNPSTYTGTLTFDRTVVSRKCFLQNTEVSCGDGKTPPFDDQSVGTLLDTDPQSGGSGGKVYDLDAPGNQPPTSSWSRLRVNFEEFVKDSAGTVVSSKFKWYARTSCQNQNNTDKWLGDVAGDNTVGPGTTPLTWNIQ